MVDRSARAAKARRMIEPRQPPIREPRYLHDEITRNHCLPTRKTVWTLTIVMTQLPDLSLLEAHDRYLVLDHSLTIHDHTERAA